MTDEGLDLDPAGRAAIWLHVNRARLDGCRGRMEAAAEHLETARRLDDATGGRSPPALRPRWRSEPCGPATSHRHATQSTRIRAGCRRRGPGPGLAWLAALGLRAEADAAEVARARHHDAGLALATDRARRIAARLPPPERTPTRRLGGAWARDPVAVRGRAGAPGWSRRRRSGRMGGRRGGVGGRGAPVPCGVLPSPSGGGAPGVPRLSRSGAFRVRDGPRDGRPAGRGTAPCRDRPPRSSGAPGSHRTSAPAGAESRPTPATEAEALGLTARELEVLKLVAGGWSNQQIADALFITRKTASVHVSNILGKLGVSGRTEAAAIAHRLGLGRDAPPPPDSDAVA